MHHVTNIILLQQYYYSIPVLSHDSIIIFVILEISFPGRLHLCGEGGGDQLSDSLLVKY